MDFGKTAGKARMLRLASFPIAQEMRTGAFRSFFRGRGIEFDSVREYQYGDDVRAIDWNVSARTGKTFVKTFSEERDLSVFIILDASKSMNTGSHGKTKLEQAFEAAALTAFAAEQLPCPVGGVVFDGKIGPFMKPAEGLDNVISLFSVFESFNTETPGSALTGAISGCMPVLSSRSLVIILSDFRAAGFKKALARLAFYPKVIAVKITDPSDRELPGCGLLRFSDPETREEILCRPDRYSFKSAWEKDSSENAAYWKSICIRSGALPFELPVNVDAAPGLASFFAAKNKIAFSSFSASRSPGA